jgi:PAS domain S-box-containing protein
MLSILSITEQKMISEMLKNPDQDFQRIVGLFEEKVMQNKEELKKSEELIKAFYDQAPYSIDIYDMDGYLIKANNVLEELWQVPKHYAVDKWNIFKSKQILEDGWLPYVKRAYAGEIVNIPDKFFDASLEPETMGRGRERWVRAVISPIKDIEGTVTNIVLIHEDITEHKNLELNLKESEQKFRTIAEQSLMGIAIFQEGIFKFVNHRMGEIYGYSEEEGLKFQAYELKKVFHPDDVEFLNDRFHEVMENQIGTSYSKDVRCIKKNGEQVSVEYFFRHIEYEGKPALLINVIDITQRKEFEIKLRESERKFRGIIEHVNEAFFISDVEGNISYISPQVSEIVGYDPEEIIGLSVEEIRETFFTDHPVNTEAFDRILLAQKGVKSSIYLNEYYHKDGSKVMTEQEETPQWNEEGEFIGTIGVVRDVTEKFELETKQEILLDELRMYKERVQSLMEQTNEGFYLFETLEPIPVNLPVEKQISLLYNGVNIECNDAQARMYGYSKAEEFMGKTLAEAHGSTDNPDNIAFIKSWIEADYNISGAVSTEFDKEGNRKWFSNNVVGIVEDGKLIRTWGTQVDITERIIAEQKIRESEEQFRTIAEQSLAAIGIFQNNEIKYINRVYEDFSGYTKEDIYSMTYSELIEKVLIPEDQERFKDYSMLTENGIVRYGLVEVRIMSTSKERKWLLGHAKRIKFRGAPAIMHILFDITERKKAQSQLKESEEKYRGLVETSSMGLVEIDYSTRELAYINPKILEILGYTYEEAIEDNAFQKFLHPEDYEKMDFSSTERRLEFRVVSKDGKIKWLSGDRLQFYDENGNLDTVRLWLQDITEKKELEKFKNNLLIRFSHEFKTPLISIKGFSDLLLKEYRDTLSEKIISFLEKINEGADRLKNLTNIFLESTQLDEKLIRLNLKQVDITELIKSVLDELEGKIKLRKQFVDVKLEENLIITCDPEKIRMVLSNVILNASKFTPQDGLITVTTAKDEEELIITIKDNGIGLTEDEIEKLFMPFGKIERYGQGLDIVPDGMGMGLYISKELVELHNGKIWVESEGRNKGSNFYIKLPIEQ